MNLSADTESQLRRLARTVKERTYFRTRRSIPHDPNAGAESILPSVLVSADRSGRGVQVALIVAVTSRGCSAAAQPRRHDRHLGAFPRGTPKDAAPSHPPRAPVRQLLDAGLTHSASSSPDSITRRNALGVVARDRCPGSRASRASEYRLTVRG